MPCDRDLKPLPSRFLALESLPPHWNQPPLPPQLPEFQKTDKENVKVQRQSHSEAPPRLWPCDASLESPHHTCPLPREASLQSPTNRKPTGGEAWSAAALLTGRLLVSFKGSVSGNRGITGKTRARFFGYQPQPKCPVIAHTANVAGEVVDGTADAQETCSPVLAAGPPLMQSAQASK